MDADEIAMVLEPDAEGRSELTDTDPVITGVAPVPVFENPSAVGFKKMTESAGATLVLG
jgi:hypothetical protein